MRNFRFEQTWHDAVDWILSVHQEWGTWPSYGAVAHRFDISQHYSHKLVNLAKLKQKSPEQYADAAVAHVRKYPKKPRHKITLRKRVHRNFDQFLVADTVVYFVSCPVPKAIKIGYSTAKNLASRFAMLQTGCPSKLTLEATIPGTVEVERELHKRFKSKHLRGEWFILDDELWDFIRSCKPCSNSL